MVPNLLAPKFLVLYVFVFSSLYQHFRGRARLPLRRQLGNHATLFAPYNVLLYWFSAVPGRPYLDPKAFPELATLRDNWQTIRAEALQLYTGGNIRAATGHNDIGFNSFYQRGWTRFYLKWYGQPQPSAAALCPRTVALVESVPTLNAAMFAVLPPGATLNLHRDPSAASLRYHLGLVTPNSDLCRIVVDGEAYSWRDGQDVMFDETYLHTAENRTDQARIILLCDVERPLVSVPMRALNRWFGRTLMRGAATQNEATEKVGWIGRLYGPVGRAKEVLKRLKAANRRVFNLVKYLAIAGALYWIFLR
jgi:beta-hydroxylase